MEYDVEAVKPKIDTKIQFWTLLGPLLILISVAVLLFKISSHWVLPLSAIIAIPLCIKWKMQGMAISILSLFILTAFNFGDLALSERYWHIGLSFTLAFSFFVLTLSLGEAQTLVEKLHQESQNHLADSLLLDEKLKLAEDALSQEKENSQQAASSAAMAISQITEEKRVLHKLALLSQEEIEIVRSNHEEMLNELQHKTQQISQLRENLDIVEQTVNEFKNTDHEKKWDTLEENNVLIEHENQALKKHVTQLQEELGRVNVRNSEKRAKISELEDLVKSTQEEKEKLEQQLYSLEKQLKVTHFSAHETARRYEALQKHLIKIEKEKDETQEKVSRLTERLNRTCEENKGLFARIKASDQNTFSVQKKIAALLQSTSEQFAFKNIDVFEKSKHVRSLESRNNRKVESMFSQLQEQFEQKCVVLDQTRQKLFELSEEIERHKKENDERALSAPEDLELNYQTLLFEWQDEYNRLYHTYHEEVSALNLLIQNLLNKED